ncbi:JAB domain-containing protein [Sphingobium chlorophenolicum]|nr:JAB domain-containing protein [Sphingobium chlorophenolicum]
MGHSHATFHGARDRVGRPISTLIWEADCQSPTLISYLEACMASLREEQVRVLFFNDAGDMIADERVWLGTPTEVEIPIEELVRHAFACGSPRLLIAHNHPSGIAEPSRQDVEFTRRLVKICRELQIRVYDHVIVTHKGSFSFREMGYM